jgi:IS605 OrfB family transposase
MERRQRNHGGSFLCANSGFGYIRSQFTAYDLQKLLKTLKPERGFIIHSTTVQEVIAVHHKARKQFKTDTLRWRTSGGPRRSLGWIPFKSVEVPIIQSTATGQVGIDLGLKDTANCSNGLKLEAHRFYRNAQAQLAKAQRANKKKRVKAIHAKNRRLDALHKFTTQVVRENAFIVVGNVSSSSLAKTKMAKSVLDAGWFMLKTQLDYKSTAMQAEFVEVNETYTTQACSCCGAISSSSPKGRAGLGIRKWTCAACGAHHDRDVNAAMNILALGHQRLAGGIPVL